MLILGLSSFDHDPAAALVQDGEVRAAMEENKLVRMATRGLPYQAIDYCLREAGASWPDLDAVAVATRPWRAWSRLSFLRAGLAVVAPVGSAYYMTREVGDLARELNNFRLLREMAGVPEKVRGLEHHLCHAADAFFGSRFDTALVLTLDEQGDGWSGAIFSGQGIRLHPLRAVPFPHSPAWVYSQVTDLLGFTPHKDEHKTQWLSLTGDPVYADLFLKALRARPGVVPRLDFRSFTPGIAGKLAFSRAFYSELGLDAANPRLMTDELRRNIAASLQHAVSVVVGDLIEAYASRQRKKNVCLGGGLLQNPLLVSALEDRFGGANIHVSPTPGNSGTAAGAAFVLSTGSGARPAKRPSPYLGPKYSGEDIKSVLDNAKTEYSHFTVEQKKLDAVVELLAAGRTVAWFQGRAEFGPRALGNRSLLASPWADYVKENLNDFIKHREWFRPFALSVTAEACDRFFESTPQAHTMSSLGRLRANSGVPEGFALPGDRVRIHVVEQESNRLFWRLLNRFGEQAPAPILLNTSFNLFGEPLVVTPRDAVRSYYSSGVDALLMENFLLVKEVSRTPSRSQ